VERNCPTSLLKGWGARTLSNFEARTRDGGVVVRITCEASCSKRRGRPRWDRRVLGVLRPLAKVGVRGRRDGRNLVSGRFSR
jgi:hypothetical protein